MIKKILYLLIFNFVAVFNIYANELKINSDKLEVDRNNNVSIFSGNVYAHNQEIKIWSDILIVKINDEESNIEELNAKNKVKIINKDIIATGEIATYYPIKDVLNMYGNVEVVENNNYVKCDELFLDIRNSMSIMKSTSTDRVEAFIINN